MAAVGRCYFDLRSLTLHLELAKLFVLHLALDTGMRTQQLESTYALIDKASCMHSFAPGLVWKGLAVRRSSHSRASVVRRGKSFGLNREHGLSSSCYVGCC